MSLKFLSFFFATNYEDTDKATEIANAIANSIAPEIEKPAAPPKQEPFAENAESEARKFAGEYICEEFKAKVHVEAKEENIEGKPVWKVYLSSADPKDKKNLSSPLPFFPYNDNDHTVFKLDGVGELKRTDEGFSCKEDRSLKPLHFRKIH